MAVTLVVEDGSGVAGANSYLDLVTAGAMFESRPHSEAWTAAATDEVRKAALVTACRACESYVQTRLGGYQGTKMKVAQALLFPRGFVPDPDPIDPALDPTYVGTLDSAQYLPSDEIPTAVEWFQAEAALLVLGSDMFALRDGAGLSSVSAGSDGVRVVFSEALSLLAKSIPPYVIDLIRPLTHAGTTAGAARVVRV